MSAPKGRHTAASNYYDDSRARLEAERSATREATRELHETVQEARDTLGELDRTMATVRKWTKQLGEDLQGTVQELVNKRTREINEHFNQQFAGFNTKMEHLTGLMIAAEHEVMGLPDKQKMMKILVHRIEEVTRYKLDEEEFRAQIADLVAEELHELWSASKASFRLRPKDAGRGQVIVRTAEPGERLGVYVEGQYVEGSG